MGGITMKKFALVILFLVLFGMVINFLIINPVNFTNSNSHKHKKDAALVNKADDYYSLWEDEADSQSVYPDELDNVEKTTNDKTKYMNHLKGYQFNYPSSWKLDNHQPENYARLYTKDFRVDITVQNVKEIYVTPHGYIFHTLSAVKPYITSDKSFNASSFQVREVDYRRPELKSMEHDLNYYSYFFITKGNYVYTFQLKTSKETLNDSKAQLKELFNSFAVTKPKNINLNSKVKTIDNNIEVSLKHDNKSLVIPKNHFLMGIYTPTPLDINKLDTFVDNHIGAQMFYKPVNSEFDGYVDQLIQQSRLPVVTFLFERANSDKNEDVVSSIINGEFDANFKNWGEGIKNTGAPVFLRLGNEMNGNWSDWSHKNNYNDPDLYKLAFRHIVSIFKKDHVDNAYFIWNPNVVSAPLFDWNHAAMYYPGDDFVDFVGMTYYNFGKTEYSHYKSFDELYGDLYWNYARSFAAKPLVIGEFGAVETGGDKAQWISDMFNHIPTKYPKIKAAIWFDETHGKYDLRIHSSETSANAFKEGMNKDEVVKSLADKQ